MSQRGVVAFAFGYPKDIDVNKMLASIAYAEAMQDRLPVFAQQDVSMQPDYRLGGVTFCAQKGESPPSTWQVAQQAARWVFRRDIDEVVLVAAPPHMPRVLRDMRHALLCLGLRDVRVVASAIYSSQPDTWFLGDSKQWYTKTERRWTIRETILCALPLWMYTYVTS